LIKTQECIKLTIPSGWWGRREKGRKKGKGKGKILV